MLSRSSLQRYAALFLLLLIGDASVVISAFTPLSLRLSSCQLCLKSTPRFSTAVFAKPGQSGAQEKQERQEEIRAMLSQLKNSGRMKGGDESVMREAEDFFKQKSPARKFEERHRARKEEEARKQKEEEGSTSGDEDGNDDTTS